MRKEECRKAGAEKGWEGRGSHGTEEVCSNCSRATQPLRILEPKIAQNKKINKN
jgi:hypothetical protein